MRAWWCGVLLWPCLAAATPLRIVVPDLNAVGPSKERAGFYAEHLASRLSEVGAVVTTSRGLEQLLGIERQRQLLGCAGEGGSCIAELAAALGTDSVLQGDVAQIDTLFQVNLKLINGADGKVIATYQARVNAEAALLDELDKAAFSLVSEAAPLLKRDAPRALKSKGPSLRVLSAIPFGVGLIGGVVGAVLFTQAGAAYGRIPQQAGDTPRPTAEVEQIAANGKAMATAGWICVGVGAAGVATGAALLIMGRSTPPPVSASVAPTPSGAMLMIGGDF
jgi:hypothetical protein